MSNNFDYIVNPKSIAVVGASNRPGSVGYAIFRNIIEAGYEGILFPVNPKAVSIQTIKAYPSLTAIPDEIDLVVVVVPTKAVPAVLEEAGKKGVKGAVVITAGFKEVGGEGVELEKQLKEVAKKYGISVIGPNCLGVMNAKTGARMNATFATKTPRSGNIAFISQSGALCTSVLDYAEERHVGFSKFISFGNKADLSEIDLLRYLKDDKDTDVIMMYLEDITDGQEFIKVAREITWEAKKPMIALKSGRSEAGAKAAASHTGSLAGSDNSYNAIFTQSGIQRVDSIDELLDYAAAFSTQPVPQGNKLAIVTNAGGPGIMATDAAIKYGLEIAKLTDKTKEALKPKLPATASLNNPVDVIGDATHERYEAAIHEIIQDENVDCMLVILTPQSMTDTPEIAEIIPNAVKGTNKPVLCSFMGVADVEKGVNYLQEHGIPNYEYPEEAIRSMSSMVKFSQRLQKDSRRYIKVEANSDAVKQIINEKLDTKPEHYMGEKEASEILDLYGFPMLKHFLIKSQGDVDAAVEHVGFPVAMKIVSPDIIHKFDAGGVILNVNSKEEALQAYNTIIANAKKYKAEAKIEGVLMEKMAKKGVEVILGAFKDPKFGPICMFGLGGTFVEVFKDVTFRLAPMWEVCADEMIDGIKAKKILKGVRGNPPSDVKAIKDCLLKLSQLVNEHPEIAELDINPLIVYPEGEGCVVADCRMMLKK